MVALKTDLTAREAQILAGVVKGLSNAQIGVALKISARTVEKHLERIYDKLGVENRTAAAVSTQRKLAKIALRAQRKPSG